ncbi:MAG: hydrolase [Alphaproteobacteria bacterium]|uniref:Hydrolase n=1 Tax=Candidatus Nitrobium versatile TaxID=2884831 RepID=A0A953M0M3_9BACT|nr:hydrolase [Candidatus Nitrobium versatile]
MEKFFLERESAAVLIIDIQERLAAAMQEKESVVRNCQHLIELSAMMGIPILLTEQYPKGLGRTVPEIRESLPTYAPLEKMTFSCCEEHSFLHEVQRTGRKILLLTGMETHICVLQTCLGLLREGFTVHIVRDAVCSRTKANGKTGLEFMRDAGAVITCTETALFQLLKTAGTEEFKAISKRIK